LTATANATPLWPQPIPIFGITGEYQAGKTWCGISISPDPKRLRVYDFELSAAPYHSLGFDYVDVPKVMAAKFPRGPKPVDVWNWWLDDVSALEPGRFDVILVDPITDLERGLTDWVTANPTKFGHTAQQYTTMSGIMWGDLKDYWKLILSTRVATKCETFAFVAHLGDEFKGKQHTGKRVPKGKDTLIELASLYLWLSREKRPDGSRPSVPSAEVLKSRLSHLTMGPDGPEIREALPPRLPVATPKAIRHYLLNPPDYTNLKPEERAAERVLTADDRLRMELARAEADRDAAMARGTTSVTPSATSAPPASPPPQPPPPPPVSPEPVPEATSHAGPSDAQLSEIVVIRNCVIAGKTGLATEEERQAAWVEFLSKDYGVTSARQFTPEQAAEFIAAEGPRHDPFAYPAPAAPAASGSPG
jgi:hypothetical protein